MNNSNQAENLQTKAIYLSVKSMAERYQLSTPSIWRIAREGLIPKPVKIGSSTRWKLSDLEAWEAKLGGEK